jgi:aspartyl-tRNA(Asn)/glutamyl-tRNA(Gln) amidotransferase subunit C
MTAKKFSATDVSHIAKLANIPVTAAEEEKLAADFNTTIGVVDDLFNVDVNGVDPTSQVTGLENILREDEIDVERQFTQEQALLNAKRTHNGFFVVDQVIEQDE